MKEKKIKTINEALNYLASQIWTKGESKNIGQQCLIPFSFNCKKKLTTYEQASKIVYAKMKVTHFDRLWKDKGKNVILKFYKGDEFGACLNLKFVEKKIVEIKP
jgi:hypothetical protein